MYVTKNRFSKKKKNVTQKGDAIRNAPKWDVKSTEKIIPLKIIKFQNLDYENMEKQIKILRRISYLRSALIDLDSKVSSTIFSSLQILVCVEHTTSKVVDLKS